MVTVSGAVKIIRRTRRGVGVCVEYALIGKYQVDRENLESLGYAFRDGAEVFALGYLTCVEGAGILPVKLAERVNLRHRQDSDMRNKPAWANLPWLEPAIDAIYAERDELTAKTGIPHEVDHIHPVNHPRLCGLTVPWNLQVIPAVENRRKSNRLESA
jgi:hypothetical protein